MYSQAHIHTCTPVGRKLCLSGAAQSRDGPALLCPLQQQGGAPRSAGYQPCRLAGVTGAGPDLCQAGRRSQSPYGQEDSCPCVLRRALTQSPARIWDRCSPPLLCILISLSCSSPCLSILFFFLTPSSSQRHFYYFGQLANTHHNVFMYSPAHP